MHGSHRVYSSIAVELEDACVEADVIIEVIPDLALKMKLFKRFDRLVPESCILASNTAGFPITALAYGTNRPSRVIGWHWAQPCIVMRLAEIVVLPETDEYVVKKIENIARTCAKNPVIINDQPFSWGVVTNRINARVREEARKIAEEGIATENQIDVLMKDCFRWPMGIFELENQTNLE